MLLEYNHKPVILQDVSKSTIGEVGIMEEVEEGRIIVTYYSKVVGNIVAAIKRVHPYDEIVMDVWSLGVR